MVDCYCSRRGSGWGRKVVVLGGRTGVVVGVEVVADVVGIVDAGTTVVAAAAADFVANAVVEAVEVAFGKIVVVAFRHVADAFVIAVAPGA